MRSASSAARQRRAGQDPAVGPRSQEEPAAANHHVRPAGLQHGAVGVQQQRRLLERVDQRCGRATCARRGLPEACTGAARSAARAGTAGASDSSASAPGATSIRRRARPRAVRARARARASRSAGSARPYSSLRLPASRARCASSRCASPSTTSSVSNTPSAGSGRCGLIVARPRPRVRRCARRPAASSSRRRGCPRPTAAARRHPTPRSRPPGSGHAP